VVEAVDRQLDAALDEFVTVTVASAAQALFQQRVVLTGARV